MSLAAATLAAAGCGSSSPSAKSASPHHMKKMAHKSSKMKMASSGKHTAAAMAAMPAAHAEVMTASSPHYGRVLYDKDHGFPKIHFGFRVKSPREVDDWRDWLKRRRIAIIEDVKEHNFTSVKFRDPDGHCIEISHER